MMMPITREALQTLSILQTFTILTSYVKRMWRRIYVFLTRSSKQYIWMTSQKKMFFCLILWLKFPLVPARKARVLARLRMKRLFWTLAVRIFLSRQTDSSRYGARFNYMKWENITARRRTERTNKNGMKTWRMTALCVLWITKHPKLVHVAIKDSTDAQADCGWFARAIRYIFATLRLRVINVILTYVLANAAETNKLIQTVFAKHQLSIRKQV